MTNKKITKQIQERFGDPIGSYAGDAPVGVRSVDETEGLCPDCGMLAVGGEGCGCHDEESMTCPNCGMMPVGGACGCADLNEGVEPCEACGMLEVEGSCGCTHVEEAEKGGPSPKTARKILRGTETFKQKEKKVSSWADDPAAAAAWMTHRATGKWPRQR